MRSHHDDADAGPSATVRIDSFGGKLPTVVVVADADCGESHATRGPPGVRTRLSEILLRTCH